MILFFFIKFQGVAFFSVHWISSWLYFCSRALLYYFYVTLCDPFGLRYNYQAPLAVALC